MTPPRQATTKQENKRNRTSSKNPKDKTTDAVSKEETHIKKTRRNMVLLLVCVILFSVWFIFLTYLAVFG